MSIIEKTRHVSIACVLCFAAGAALAQAEALSATAPAASKITLERFPLVNAHASAIKAYIEERVAPDPSLAGKVQIVADPRTNTLIVKGDEDAVSRVGAMIAQQDEADDVVEAMKAAKDAHVDKVAPDFKLVDANDKEHTLSDYVAQGKTVVLEWINPDCPYVHEHYRSDGKGTSNAVQKEFSDKNVVWLRINSGAEDTGTNGKERMQAFAKDNHVQGPILIDIDGKVGRMYHVKVTPEIFVITKKGVVAYHGTMDSDLSPRKTGEIIYPRAALTSVLAGETVEHKETKCVGCAIKYAPEKKD